MLKRYGGGAGDVFSMPFSDGCELIDHAQDADYDDRLFLRWAVMYQHGMSFGEFKNELKGGMQVKDDKSAEEILDKVKGIIG